MSWRKVKAVVAGCVVVVSLVACGPRDVPKEAAESTKTNIESAENVSKTNISFSVFDTNYERNPEYEPYIDNVFLLKDGTKLSADCIQYLGTGAFDYAYAIFHKGRLVNLNIETKKSIEDVEMELGINFTDDVLVDPTSLGFVINFDPRFLRDNIEEFPEEFKENHHRTS